MGRVDPSGLSYYGILDRDHELAVADKITFACFDDDGDIKWLHSFDTMDALISWRKGILRREGKTWRQDDADIRRISSNSESVYWSIMTLTYLNYEQEDYKSNIQRLWEYGVNVHERTSGGSQHSGGTISWDSSQEHFGGDMNWHYVPPLAMLAHELGHAIAAYISDGSGEGPAMDAENVIRYAYYKKIPGYGEGEQNQVWARPAYGKYWATDSWNHPDISWETYWDEDDWPYGP